MFLRAKMTDGSVDAETEFHKATLLGAKMLVVNLEESQSKILTNIFLQDEESILVH